MRKHEQTSSVARRITTTVTVVCAAHMFIATESPRAQPSGNSSGVPALATTEESANTKAQNLEDSQAPAIQSNTPVAEAAGVSGRDQLIVQFNKRMAVASLNSQSITLVGPTGAEPTDIVPVDQGMRVFIRPGKELLPASRYTLFINGATDDAQRRLPLSAIGFDTSAKPAGMDRPIASVDLSSAPPDLVHAFQQSLLQVSSQGSDVDDQPSNLGPVEQQAVTQAAHTSDPEDWLPSSEHFKGRWHADRASSPLQALPPLQAPAGVTALAGQVLGMNGQAVPGVTLRIGGQEARTDITGRFLLPGLEAGFVKVEIDGASADRPGSRYGYYAARIELKPQQTNVVPYVIWMPRLDSAGTVRIAAPTTTETIITSPRIPGLELHIPAGTVIRDRQGRIVTEINVTAIPVDRPPFPVPDLGVPVYFTVQPGGAVLQSVTGKPSPGARLFYPNFRGEVPGARGVFWNYDPDDREWFVYGMGTISRDRKQAIPDEGVVIHEFTGAMFNGSNAPGPNGPPPCDCGGSGGDPVSLYTGQFDHIEHDLTLSDVMPIDIGRTYYSSDKNQRAFGIGMTHTYDVFLFSQNQYQEVDLILPNGTHVHYVRTSPGTSYTDAIFEASAPGPWDHSIVARNNTRFGWDLIFRDGRKWYFQQFQPLLEMTDANGNTTRIVREANNGTSGKITRIISPNGRTVDFSYNAAGFISALTDNLGRNVSYAYDGDGRLTQVVDPLGGTHTYTWDTANNRLTAIHDAVGNLVIQNQYDNTTGRVAAQTMADGSSFTFAYTLQNGVATQIDITDPRGSVRRVEFDAAGYMTKNSFPLGLPEEQVVRYENASGQLTATVDALGRRTEYQYDAAGNLTRVTRLAGTSNAASTITTYDTAFALPLTITDANGNTTAFTYDARGNLTGITDPLGHTTVFTSDSQGRPHTSTDALGRVTTTGYDGPDIATTTDTLGRQVQYVTDAVGRVVATVDPLGNRTVFDYDDLNRLVNSTDALGGVTSFTYDGNGHLLAYTDAKGNTAGYEYSSLGKVSSFWDARNKWETRLYEPGGNVKQFIDRKGQLRSVSYDAVGRVKTVSFGATAAHPTAYQSQIVNTWDAGNRLIQIEDRTCADPLAHLNCSSIASSTTITRTYDDLDRKVSEVTPQGEVGYTFDNVGRRSSMTVKNGPPGAQIVQPVISYTYDNAGRLTGIHQTAGVINGGQPQDIAFTYDAVGEATQVTLANGTTIAYAYDDASQPTSILYKQADGTLIGDLQYQYDAGGHRIGAGGSLARIDLPASDITDASYDANNRLLTWAGKSYTYDDNGNLTGDGANTYQWSARNRLDQITAAGGDIASFQYDGLGRRIGKTIGAATTGFLYDHKNVVQELAGISNTAAVKAHLLAAGLDQTFLRIEGNDGATLRSVLGDANSNTVMLLDAAQQAVVNYSYGPYGATTADASTDNVQQFAGRDNDNPGIDQGLYYYRARYYMPGIARFISEDPIGWTSGQTNNYAYVGGNPINFRDPLGLSAADGFESFSAGFGDGLTFGLTRWLRGKLGIDGVNTCSGWYAGGMVTGVVAVTIATAGVGTEAEAGVEGAEALAEEEAVAEGAAAEGAENAPNAIDPNSLHHIFGKASHNLGPLLAEFGGSQEAAYNAIRAATEAAVRSGGITGIFKNIVVTVGSRLVTVRGAVVDGVVRLSTAFIPGV